MSGSIDITDEEESYGIAPDYGTRSVPFVLEDKKRTKAAPQPSACPGFEMDYSPKWFTWGIGFSF